MTIMLIYRQITPPEDVLVEDFRGCLRAVTPAMLVLFSWFYVGLANVNMVGCADVQRMDHIPVPTLPTK